jgi:DNA-binding CsgD family transcriptional regulator/tetratricopeptide (TPR) repeat protein
LARRLVHGATRKICCFDLIRSPSVSTSHTERVDGSGFGWWAGRVAESVSFVGRDSELSRLLAAVGGDVRLFLITGDAGVGKTRLVTEGMARLADGAIAVWGGCLPMRETLPLLPLADALGELSRVDRGGVLESALTAAPGYVRGEVARLLPELGLGAAESADPAGGQRDRLFAAIADLLGVVARRRRIVLVVEDVHCADAATLDCLTFLTRARSNAAVPVVVTCRSDEAPLDSQVVDWLAHVRGRGGAVEVRLGSLTRDEMAEQVARLAGSPVPAPVVDELYARTEGNPFFTEQLVAAALSEGAVGLGVGLPARLAELLVTRAAGCALAARTVLSGLAVAGRPLDEDLLGAVGGLDVDEVRGGLRELAAARLLADADVDGGHRPRHALLAEAVAADMLPGERAAFHERVAAALQAAGDAASAAEVAGHWAAAGRAEQELPARVRAAEAAERVFGYAEAARHWQRAIDLFEQVPDPEHRAGMDLPHLYLRGLDALWAAGDRADGGVLAGEAYRRFADHPDPAIAASVHLRAAWFARDTPTDARPLFEQALRLFEQVTPSVDHAKAWTYYAGLLLHAEGRGDARRTALIRALEVAEAAGATGVAASIQIRLAHDACLRGRVAEGLAMVERARALAEASGDGEAVVDVAEDESDTLLKMGRFDRAAEAGLRGLQAAHESGRSADVAAVNAAEAMLALGRVAKAAELIDPLTSRPADRDHYPVHELRAEIDLLRGDIDTAAGRLQRITSVVGRLSSIDNAGAFAQRTAEVAVWAGRPADGLAEVRDVLTRYHSTDWTTQCGWLLVLGVRACADLAGQGRARHDEYATQTALAAADDLAEWVERMGGNPFVDHPYVATIPAARATWHAERSRLFGVGDPVAWQAAADAWAALGVPHRAGYAGWRQAEARLLAGEPPAAVTDTLRSAAVAADEHVPLLAAIHALADRARIPLDTAASAAQPSEETVPYGLTEREVLVLRLLVAGRSNGEIGADLFISRKTASVHVSNILRKLGVSNRAQAAALAERAGLVSTSSTSLVPRSPK